MSAARTPKPPLTARQKQIYDFLKDKIINRGYGPTVREIGNHFKIRSPNGVMCHLKALERKGLITRESHMSRAIQLTDDKMPGERLTDIKKLLKNLSSSRKISNNVRDQILALIDG